MSCTRAAAAPCSVAGLADGSCGILSRGRRSSQAVWKAQGRYGGPREAGRWCGEVSGSETMEYGAHRLCGSVDFQVAKGVETCIDIVIGTSGSQ
jgi:hypothetical protein